MATNIDRRPTPIVEEATEEIDTVLRTLSKPRRRSVLKQVCDHAGPISATDLAAAVVASEFDEFSAEEQTRVFRSLRHVHLPKLAETGLIEYDRATETATATETGDNALASLQRSLT